MSSRVVHEAAWEFRIEYEDRDYDSEYTLIYHTVDMLGLSNRLPNNFEEEMQTGWLCFLHSLQYTDVWDGNIKHSIFSTQSHRLSTSMR